MNREEIERWLKKYDITNYVIRNDLVVDVNGSVYLYDKKLTVLPFQFGTVTGYFYCANNNVTSLQYCPTSVGGGFDCSNNKLTTPQYCPTTIGGKFYCSRNPFIVTEENENHWIEAIKNHERVYHYIKEPTEALTSFYKMMYEI